jgi:hypothetical protein
MSSRDLLLRRTTDDVKGNTTWETSPLVKGAVNGQLIILDGVHRLESDTLASLASLLQHQECDLADGRRLLRWDRFDLLLSKWNSQAFSATLTPAAFSQKFGILRIDPDFEVVALANRPTGGASIPADQWLNSEMLTLFHFVQLPPLSKGTISDILKDQRNGEKLLDEKSAELHKLVNLSKTFEQKNEACREEGSTPMPELSLRQLKRIWSQYTHTKDTFQNTDQEVMADLLHRTMLTKFMPPPIRDFISQAISDSDFAPMTSPNTSDDHFALQPQHLRQDGEMVQIGSLFMPVRSSSDFAELIPDTLFYQIPHHTYYLENIARDIQAGERWILLIGNQGTGKNKLIDHLLQQLKWPRQYMQLHRDTSIQSLTTTPTVNAGKISYDDSPLVKAVQEGHMLVIDEADKAPTEVICILKTLLEDGQMTVMSHSCIVLSTKDEPVSIINHPW